MTSNPAPETTADRLRPQAAHGSAEHGQRALAEPYAFVLLQWPAVAAWFALDGDDWQPAARIALGLWIVATALGAYSAGRGAVFGNIMLLLLACAAFACWMHPAVWTFAAFPVLLIGLYAAQRARMGTGRSAAR